MDNLIQVKQLKGFKLNEMVIKRERSDSKVFSSRNIKWNEDRQNNSG